MPGSLLFWLSGTAVYNIEVVPNDKSIRPTTEWTIKAEASVKSMTITCYNSLDYKKKYSWAQMSAEKQLKTSFIA